MMGMYLRSPTAEEAAATARRRQGDREWAAAADKINLINAKEKNELEESGNTYKKAMDSWKNIAQDYNTYEKVTGRGETYKIHLNMKKKKEDEKKKRDDEIKSRYEDMRKQELLMREQETNKWLDKMEDMRKQELLRREQDAKPKRTLEM